MAETTFERLRDFMGTHPARHHDSAPVTHGAPSSPITVQTVALNIAGHREELLRLNPGALELAAECIFAFHEDANGSMTTVLASRSGSYAREQGTGKRSLTVEDLCEMVTRGGAEGRSAVRALLAPIISRLDESGLGADLAEAGATFAREACDVTEALMLGKTDTQIRTEIREAREALRVLEAAQAARQRVSAKVAQVIGGRQ